VSWARVISGSDEGIYGWIALNYLTGHLALGSAHAAADAAAGNGVSGQSGRLVASGWLPETVGAIDLGGSSLEISYVVDEEGYTHGPNNGARVLLSTNCRACVKGKGEPVCMWRRRTRAMECQTRRWQWFRWTQLVLLLNRGTRSETCAVAFSLTLPAFPSPAVLCVVACAFLAPPRWMHEAAPRCCLGVQ
jgi:GDA1/CD39 (nucleoside phosphatase) family